MRLLLSAFACAPGFGSEPENGWNWAAALGAMGHEVTVLTVRSRQDSRSQDQPHSRVAIEPVETPAWTPSLRGQLTVYSRYLAWQVAALQRARFLVRAHRFDLVHHLTWGSLHLGSWMWRLGLPFVYGPTGGGQVAPRALRTYYEGDWRSEVLRTVVAKDLAWVLPTATMTMRNADVVLVNNRETARLARSLRARHVRYLSEIGLLDNQVGDRLQNESAKDRPLRLLWVGRFLPRKGLPLAMRAVQRVPRALNIHLTIVGWGPQDEWARHWVKERGLHDRIVFTGRVPFEEVIKHYRTSDALLFTSIRDSSGAQLLEAMGQGLPVITLDHQGAALLVPRTAGYHVPVADADSTLQGLVSAITKAASDPTDRQRRSKAALAFAQSQTWPRKAEEMTRVYERLLSSHKGR